MDFHIGPVRSSQRHRTVKHEFHIAGTGGFLGSEGYLLGNITGGNQLLRIAYIIIFHHDDLHILAGFRILIHDFLQNKEQMDDILCNDISGCRLGTEYIGYRSRWLLSFFNFQVFMNDVQRIHLLALILMKPLGLDIKYGIRVDFHPFFFLYEGRQFFLIIHLDGFQTIQEFFIIFEFQEFLQFICILLEAAADPFLNQRGQFPVTGKQPSAEGNAVCLIIELFRINLIKCMQLGIL